LDNVNVKAAEMPIMERKITTAKHCRVASLLERPEGSLKLMKDRASNGNGAINSSPNSTDGTTPSYENIELTTGTQDPDVALNENATSETDLKTAEPKISRAKALLERVREKQRQKVINEANNPKPTMAQLKQSSALKRLHRIASSLLL
jgi:hypothetical protein